MTLTKAEIAVHLSHQLNIQQLQAKFIVNQFFEAIRIALDHEEIVKLSGFGNFTLRDKKSRPGRNPKTGVEVMIAPRRVVTFKAGHKLKAEVEAPLKKLTAKKV
jgi:integration host factor subunit alpha